MGVVDKLKFWKKKEDNFGDLGLGKDDLGLGSDPFAGEKNPFADEKGLPPMDAGPSASDMMQAQPQYPPAQSMTQRGAYGSGYSQGFGSQPQQQAYGQPLDQPDFNRPFTMAMQQTKDYTVAKDIELISSKLDALRASLDIINQRLSNIERLTEREQVRKRTGW